jgi:transcriptional regulator with XRE-family HTH domain
MSCKAALIGELKARREALGWSVAQLGDRSGLDARALGQWEQGEGSPNLDAVYAWAATLGLCVTLGPAGSTARSGISVDWQRRNITVDGMPIRLTPMEWKALERLAAVPGEIVTHRALFEHLYGADQPYRAESTAIRVLITKLRRLLPLRIEARWGRGYVLSGLGPSSEANTPERRREDEPASPTMRSEVKRRESLSVIPNPAMREAPVIRRDLANTSHPAIRRPPPPPSAGAPRRAEELSVIEKFLAERGATRCPDMATIQRAPLPTLVWDKMKRKWVRPTGGATLEAS